MNASIPSRHHPPHAAQKPVLVESLPQPDMQRLLEQKDRALEQLQKQMAEMAVELAVLRKKTNGGSWER